MTTSYKAGTVSVSAGSRRVTGISTGWILANISPGYFGLSDGQGSVVPVEAIVSDTELDLFVPWSGPSLSGQEYWLSYDTRDGQQTVNNAQRLAEYVARLDSDALSAISGLDPSANKIIKFTGESAATLVDFGAGAEALLNGGVLPNLQLPERLRITGSVSTDANTIVDNGWYVVAATAANIPEAQPGVIVHSVISSAFMVQEYTRRGTNIIYQRSSSGSVWGAWVRIMTGSAAGVIENSLLPPRIRSESLDASADFNNAIENGFYLGSTASVNSPATGVRHALLVQSYSSVYIIQTCWQIAGEPRGWTRTRFNGVWSDWRLFGLRVIGTVAQSGGGPTGAIIERGSNANGEYVRFADGTQMCWFNNITLNKAAGLVEVTWTYPIAFASLAYAWVNMNARTADGGAGRSAYSMTAITPSATTVNVIIAQLDGATAQTGVWSGNRVFAIGRWF